jgi:flavin reductase (DIM6/NTAB) family NADH-FMN oxidoreductase RutF
VAPPRVARSPVAIECVLEDTVCLGDSTVVFGRVVHLAIAEGVMVDGHPEIDRLRPLSRLGRNEWGLLGEVRRISRIPFDDWPGHFGERRT